MTNTSKDAPAAAAKQDLEPTRASKRLRLKADERAALQDSDINSPSRRK